MTTATILLEREHKFLVQRRPGNLEAVLLAMGMRPNVVAQVYVARDEDGVVTRARRMTLPNGEVRLALESKSGFGRVGSSQTFVKGEPVERIETEDPLTEEQFGAYAAQALVGNLPWLVKNRYSFEHEYDVVVDIYDRRSYDMAVVEVELEPGQVLDLEAHPLPEVLGEVVEVTHNPNYYNEVIALRNQS